MFTGQFCDDFMVQLNVLVTENFAITFANGREFIGGRLIVEAVNLETGTSVTVNVSGPVFIGSGGDPFILRGNSLLFAEAGDFGPGTSCDTGCHLGHRHVSGGCAGLHAARSKPKPLL